MKTICLDGWHSHPITVSDEGYTALVALVNQHRVCSRCSASYGTDLPIHNPMVVENTCLGCVIQQHPHLTFAGPVGEPDAEGYQWFEFLDTNGYVYLSSSRYSDEPRTDTYQTLAHWGFSVPTVYTPFRGEEVRLQTNNWYVYGDVVEASALVIERSYDAKHSCVFLSYKGGGYRELTKRDAEMKSLLEQAKDIIEESKDKDGWYQLGSYPTKYIRDSVLYQVVSQIASAIYDVKCRLSKDIAVGKQAAESQEVSAS